MSRLTQVKIGGSTNEGYTYDAVGNRLTKTDASGTVQAYVYDAANQLKEIHQGSTGGPLLTSLSYDDNGNLMTKSDTVAGVLQLSYDPLDRLVQVSKPGADSENYLYDDQGRRIQKTVGGTITNYLYHGQAIAAEYTGTWNSAAAVYTHGGGVDQPLIRTTATTAQYYHQDGLGSVTAVTDQTGATVGTARYDAWGNKLSGAGGIPQYGYTGREPNQTGLIYYRGRYYDPAIGRFIQRDPIGMAGGMNLYAYVNGNPVNFTDPMGTLPRDVSTLNLDTVTTSPYNTSTPGLDSANQSLADLNSGTNSGGISIVIQGGLPSFAFNGSLGSLSENGVEPIAQALERQQMVQRLNSSQLQEGLGFGIVAAGSGQPFNIVGHSFGGDTGVDIARGLSQVNIPVTNLVTIDSVGFNNTQIPANVRTNLNFYQNGFVPFLPSPLCICGGPNAAVDPTQTQIINVLRPEGHLGITGAPVRQQIENQILRGQP